MPNTDTTGTMRQVVDELHAAFNSRDAERVLALMTDNVIFENTGPAPDGTRFVGKDETRRFWEQFFTDSPNATIEIEDVLVGDDHATVMHRYSWSVSPHGDDPGYVRGVTIYRIRNGKIAAMYPYVKG